MKVQCPQCSRNQEDEGVRSSCGKCGYQPLPSYDRPKDSVFHPDYKGPPKRKRESVSRTYKELKKRKAAR